MRGQNKKLAVSSQLGLLPTRVKHPACLDESALLDETPDEKAARLRSHDNKCYRAFYKLVTFWGFNFVITLMICLNTVCLAADTFDQNSVKEDILEILGTVFTWVFIVEAIVKIIGLGPKCYVRDHYNIFDAFVAILSLVDFAITFITEL